MCCFLQFRFFLFGCNGGSSTTAQPNEQLLGLVSQNRAKWEESNLTDYMFTYSSMVTDCPLANPFPPVVITVHSSQVSMVYVPAFGIFMESTSGYPTIGDIFDRMEAELKESPAKFAKEPNEANSLPEFDSRYGFPTQFFYDLDSNASCDAFDVSVTEFQ